MPRDMWTSISAIEDAGGKFGDAGCMRRWWFKKIMKMPVPKKPATIFGDILHATVARYLLADDRGLDVEGKIVNIYPEGWMSTKEKYGDDQTIYTISDTEAALIKVWIDAAISQGVLIRYPGREIEKPVGDFMYKDSGGQKQFGRVLLVEGNIKKTRVVLKGSIDLETPRKIEDHKTVKDTSYALSINKLRKNIQMMTYALDKYERGHDGTLWIAHNNYVKDYDRPQVIQREVEVTVEEVYGFYNDVTLPIVKKMFDIYLRYDKSKIEKWRDVSPAVISRECNFHYGKPCLFINICSGRCSIDVYLAKYDKSLSDYIETNNKQEKEATKMPGLLDRIKEQNATLTQTVATTLAQNATPAVTPTVAPTVIPTTVPTTAAPSTTPAASGGALEAIMNQINQQKAAASKPEVTEPVSTIVPPASITSPAPAPTAGPAVMPPFTITTPAPDKQKAPWYIDCLACKGNDILGYNSKGNPCVVCLAKAKHAGLQGPEAYDITSGVDASGKGILIFTPKAGQPATEAKVANPSEVKMTSTAVAPPTVIEDDFLPTSYPEKAVEEAKAFVGTLKATPSGFDLLIGCVYISQSNTEKIILGDILLKEVMEVIETQANQKAATIEHFALMAAIDAYIPAVVEMIQGTKVVAFTPGKGTALARLIDGLRPHASNIICPMGL